MWILSVYWTLARVDLSSRSRSGFIACQSYQILIGAVARGGFTAHVSSTRAVCMLTGIQRLPGAQSPQRPR